MSSRSPIPRWMGLCLAAALALPTPAYGLRPHFDQTGLEEQVGGDAGKPRAQVKKSTKLITERTHLFHPWHGVVILSNEQCVGYIPISASSVYYWGHLGLRVHA